MDWKSNPSFLRLYQQTLVSDAETKARKDKGIFVFCVNSVGT